MKIVRLVCVLLFVALIAVPALADEKSPSDEAAKKEDAKQADEEKDATKKTTKAETDKKDADKPERKTHTVKATPLKITTDVEGVFVARETAEIALRPEEWSDFEIVEIVPHGQTVSKGEVLVKFDAEKLNEQIEELELELRLGELAMMKAEQELPRATVEIEREHEQAKRSLAEAEADYKRYREIDRDMSLKSADMNMKSVESYVEGAREELRQLEKMYEADDLTEETEEIILKRQRAEVEQAEFMLESYKQDYEQTINVYIPRRDIAEKESLERVKLAFERAKTALETDRSKGKYELEKERESRREAIEKHAKLLSDRALMEIRSPADGVVYYGGATDGEWAETASLVGSMRKYGSAPTKSVMMTIVKSRPLYVIGTIAEAARADVKIGQSATIESAADDGPKLSGKLKQLSPIPMGDKKYRVELTVDGKDIPDWIVPGLTAKAKLVTYENKKALMVPKSAVKSEAANDDAKYVMVETSADAKPKKQKVTVGKTKDDNIEIVEGLEAGAKIVLEEKDKEAKE